MRGERQETDTRVATFVAEVEHAERTGGAARIAMSLAASALVASYLARGSVVGAVAMQLLGLFLAVAFYDRRLTRRVRSRLRVTDDAITLEPLESRRSPPRRIARGEIASAALRPAGRAAYVRLRAASGKEQLEVRVHDIEEGEALLAALALDSGRHAFVHHVTSPLGAALGTIRNRALAFFTVLGVGIPSLYAGLSPFYAIALGALVTLLATWPAQVIIASDGVMLTWFRRRRFIAFSDVVDIQTASGRSELVLKNGERTPIVGDAAVEEQLHAAWARFREGAGDPALAALVERRERDVGTWVDDLRRMRAESVYRAKALDDEALLRVAEDPAIAPDARAGAVVLLRPTLDDAGRERIRVAASTTAEPRLRVALDALAEAEDEAVITEQLEALRRE